MEANGAWVTVPARESYNEASIGTQNNCLSSCASAVCPHLPFADGRDKTLKTSAICHFTNPPIGDMLIGGLFNYKGERSEYLRSSNNGK